MITIAQSFSRTAQARQAMLDLLTGGVPRPDIGVVIGPPNPGASGDERDYAAIAALDNAVAFSLPGGGEVTAVGPLAEALGQARGETDQAIYNAALLAIGVSAAEARVGAQQLAAGGALVAVRTDPVRETIVYGVFNHALNPALSAQGEPQGPESARAVNDEPREPPSAAVGALSSSTIPGGWGSAGLEATGLDEDETRPD